MWTKYRRLRSGMVKYLQLKSLCLLRLRCGQCVNNFVRYRIKLISRDWSNNVQCPTSTLLNFVNLLDDWWNGVCAICLCMCECVLYSIYYAMQNSFDRRCVLIDCQTSMEWWRVNTLCCTFSNRLSATNHRNVHLDLLCSLTQTSAQLQHDLLRRSTNFQVSTRILVTNERHDIRSIISGFRNFIISWLQ